MRSAVRIKYLTTLFILAGLVISPLGAQSSKIHLPDFSKETLLNGMEFLFIPSQEQRVSFVLMIENGAAFDPVEKWGLTYLMTETMLQGVEDRTGRYVGEQLKAVGAELRCEVDWDAVFFVGSAPAAQLTETLNILADAVIRPRFEDAVFLKIQEELLSQLESERSQTEARTRDLLLQEIFRGNPYEHSVRGTPETVRNIFLVDLKRQHRRLFIPNQARLATFISGDPQELVRNTSRRWGSWVKDNPIPFTFRPADPIEGPQILLLSSPAETSLFRWGKLGVSKDDRDFYALKVFEQYLLLSLPEWAREVTSHSQIQAVASFNARRMPGYIELSIQAPPESLLVYLDKLKGLVEEMQNGKLHAARFEEAKKLALVEFTGSLDDPVSLLYQLLRADLYGVGVNYLTNYGLRLDRVGVEDLQRAVTRYLNPESFVLVVAAPADSIQAQLDRLGDVRLLN